jgi:hypothetical protein
MTPSRGAAITQRLRTMPPHHLGGLYTVTLVLTTIAHHFLPALWFPLAILEIFAFAVLFIAAVFLRLDDDVVLAAFLVCFSVGIALIVSDAVLGVIVHHSLGAIALSTPARALALLLRGFIVIPLSALVIWALRRIQRGRRPPPARPHMRDGHISITPKR